MPNEYRAKHDATTTPATGSLRDRLAMAVAPAALTLADEHATAQGFGVDSTRTAQIAARIAYQFADECLKLKNAFKQP